MIAFAARQKCFEETPESRAAMEDLALASRVRASLIADPKTAQVEVEIAAHAGGVTLKGMAYTPEQIKEIQNVVRKIPGVHQVQAEMSVTTADG